MTRWIHTTQAVEVATLCRPPRSRTPRIVRETVSVPVRIRELDEADAPAALRIDRDAAKATMTYVYGGQGRTIVYDNMMAGSAPNEKILEFRSAPDGSLCVDTGPLGDEPWPRGINFHARAEIEKGRDPAIEGYAGPDGASDVEWSTHARAVRTIQRMADDLRVVGGRLFSPCDAPYLVRETERQAGTPAQVWSISNRLHSPKSENAYLSLQDAVAEMPDVAGCVEIVDEHLLPGIGPTLLKAVSQGLSDPSFAEVVLAGRIVEAAGAAAPWTTPVDWEALDLWTRELRTHRSLYKSPNDITRIVLDLPVEAMKPAPGRTPTDDAEPESVFLM